MRTFFIILFLSLLSTLASAEIYKWVDENGRINFSDKSQNSEADYYVPKTEVSSYEEDYNSKAFGKNAANQSDVQSSANRKRTQEVEMVVVPQSEARGTYQERELEKDNQLKQGLRLPPKRTKAFANTQAQYDKQTNYDGYGSELNRYQNAILMKTHNSILKGGNMEYWNGLDEFHYNNLHRVKVRRHRW
jgi:hypothetical protein